MTVLFVANFLRKCLVEAARRLESKVPIFHKNGALLFWQLHFTRSSDSAEKLTVDAPEQGGSFGVRHVAL